MKFKRRAKLLLGAMIGVSLIGTPLALVKMTLQDEVINDLSLSFDNKEFSSESELKAYVERNYKQSYISDINEQNYVLNEDGSKSYLSQSQINSIQEKINNSTSEKTILTRSANLDSGMLNAEVGELSPKWFEQNQIDVTKPINFWRSDKNGVTLEKAEALDSFMNSGYEVYYFNDIFFKSKNDLYRYLVNIYFVEQDFKTNTSFRIKAPNGQFSKVISTSARTDWRKVATTFIQDNCKPLVKIDLGDGNFKFVNPDNTSALRTSININNIPFLKVKANNSKKRYVIGLNQGDTYQLSGPLYYEGFQNIRKAISNKDNWVKQKKQFVPSYVDTQIESINNNINNFFQQYIKDDGNITKVDAVQDANNKAKNQWSVANDDLLFSEKITAKSVNNFYYENDVSGINNQDKIFTKQSTINSNVGNYESNLNDVVNKQRGVQNNALSSMSKNLKNAFYSDEYTKYRWIYDDTLATANNFRTMKQYSIIMKIPLLYNYMLDKLIGAGAPDTLIWIVRDYFRYVADLFTNLVRINLGHAAMEPAPKYKSFGELNFARIFNIDGNVVDFNIEQFNNFFATVYPGIGSATAISKEIRERIMLGTEPTIDDLKTRAINYVDTYFKDVDIQLSSFLKNQFVEIGIHILENSFNTSKNSDLFDEDNSYAAYSATVMSLANEDQLTYRDEILDLIESEASELLNSTDSWELVSNDNRFKTFAYYIQEMTGTNVTPKDILGTINVFDHNTLLGWNNAFLELEYNLRTDPSLNNIANVISQKSLAYQYLDSEMDLFDKELSTQIQKINDQFYDAYFGDYAGSSNVDYIFRGIYLSFEQFASITLMRMLGDLSKTNSLFKFDSDYGTVMINDKYAKKATQLVHSILTSKPELIAQLGHLYRSFQAVQQAIDACAEQYEFSSDKQFSLSPIAIKLMLQNTAQYASIINQNIEYLQTELKTIGVPLKVGQIIAYSGTETSSNKNEDTTVTFEPSFNKERTLFNSDSKIATDLQTLIPFVDHEQTTYVVPNMDVVGNKITNINPLLKSYLIPVTLINQTSLVNGYEYSLEKYFDMSLVTSFGFVEPNAGATFNPYFDKKYRFHINEQVPSDEFIYLKKWGSANQFENSYSTAISNNGRSNKQNNVLGVRRELKQSGIKTFKTIEDTTVFEYSDKRSSKTVHKFDELENISEEIFDLSNDFIEKQQTNNNVKTISSIANKLIAARVDRANPDEVTKEAIAKANEVDIENKKSGLKKRFMSFEMMNVINNATIKNNDMIAWSLSWIENKEENKNVLIHTELKRIAKQLILNKFNKPLIDVLKNDAYYAAMDYDQLLKSLSFDASKLSKDEQLQKIISNIDTLQKYLCDIGESNTIVSLANTNNALDSKLLKTVITGEIDETLEDDEEYKNEINKIHDDYLAITNKYWKKINANFLMNNFEVTTNRYATNYEEALFGEDKERKLVVNSFSDWMKAQNSLDHENFVDFTSIDTNAQNWKKLNAYIKPQKEIDDQYLKRTYNNTHMITRFFNVTNNETSNFDSLWATNTIKGILKKLIKNIKADMNDDEEPSETLTYYEDLLARTILDVKEEPWKIDEDVEKYIERLIKYGNLFPVKHKSRAKISALKSYKSNKKEKENEIITNFIHKKPQAKQAPDFNFNDPVKSLPNGFVIKGENINGVLYAKGERGEKIYFDQDRTWYKISWIQSKHLYYDPNGTNEDGNNEWIPQDQWESKYQSSQVSADNIQVTFKQKTENETLPHITNDFTIDHENKIAKSNINPEIVLKVYYDETSKTNVWYFDPSNTMDEFTIFYNVKDNYWYTSDGLKTEEPHVYLQKYLNNEVDPNKIEALNKKYKVPSGYEINLANRNQAFSKSDKSLTIEKMDGIQPEEFYWVYSYDETDEKVLVHNGDKWCNKNMVEIDNITPSTYKYILDNAKKLPKGFKPVSSNYPFKLQYGSKQIYATLSAVDPVNKILQYKATINLNNGEQVNCVYNGTNWVDETDNQVYDNFKHIYNKYNEQIKPSTTPLPSVQNNQVDKSDYALKNATDLPPLFVQDLQDPNRAISLTNENIVIVKEYDDFNKKDVWKFKYKDSNEHILIYDAAKKVWCDNEMIAINGISPEGYSLIMDFMTNNMPEGFSPKKPSYPFILQYHHGGRVEMYAHITNVDLVTGKIDIAIKVPTQFRVVNFQYENGRWINTYNNDVYNNFDDVYKKYILNSQYAVDPLNPYKIPIGFFVDATSSHNEFVAKSFLHSGFTLQYENLPNTKTRTWVYHYMYNGVDQRLYYDYDAERYAFHNPITNELVHFGKNVTPYNIQQIVNRTQTPPEGFNIVTSHDLPPILAETIVDGRKYYASYYGVNDVGERCWTVNIDKNGMSNWIRFNEKTHVWSSADGKVIYESFADAVNKILDHSINIPENRPPINNQDLIDKLNKHYNVPEGFDIDINNPERAISKDDPNLILYRFTEGENKNNWAYRYNDSNDMLLIYKDGKWHDKSMNLLEGITPKKYKFILENLDKLPKGFKPVDPNYPFVLKFANQEIYAKISNINPENGNIDSVVALTVGDTMFEVKYTNGQWVDTRDNTVYQDFMDIYNKYFGDSNGSINGNGHRPIVTDGVPDGFNVDSKNDKIAYSKHNKKVMISKEYDPIAQTEVWKYKYKGSEDKVLIFDGKDWCDKTFKKLENVDPLSYKLLLEKTKKLPAGFTAIDPNYPFELKYKDTDIIAEAIVDVNNKAVNYRVTMIADGKQPVNFIYDGTAWYDENDSSKRYPNFDTIFNSEQYKDYFNQYHENNQTGGDINNRPNIDWGAISNPKQTPPTPPGYVIFDAVNENGEVTFYAAKIDDPSVTILANFDQEKNQWTWKEPYYGYSYDWQGNNWTDENGRVTLTPEQARAQAIATDHNKVFFTPEVTGQLPDQNSQFPFPEESTKPNLDHLKPILPQDGRDWTDPKLITDQFGERHWVSYSKSNPDVSICVDVNENNQIADNRWWHYEVGPNGEFKYIGFYDVNDGKWYKATNSDSKIEYDPIKHNKPGSSHGDGDNINRPIHGSSVDFDDERSSERLQLSEQMLDSDNSLSEDLTRSISQSSDLTSDFLSMSIDGETGTMSVREMSIVSGDHVGDYRYIPDNYVHPNGGQPNVLAQKYNESQTKKKAISFAKVSKLFTFIDMFDFAFGIFQLVEMFKGIVGRDVTTTYTFKTDDAEWTWSGGLSHECSKNIITSSYDIRTAASMLMNDAIEVSGTYTNDFLYWNGKQYEDDANGRQNLINDYIAKISMNEDMMSYSFGNVEDDVVYANEANLNQLGIADSKEELVETVTADIESNGQESQYITDSIKTYSDGYGGNWDTIDSHAAIENAARGIQNRIRPSIVSMKPILDEKGNLVKRRDFNHLPGNNYNPKTGEIITEEQKIKQIPGYSTEKWFYIDNSANQMNESGDFVEYNHMEAIKQSQQRAYEKTKSLYLDNVESVTTYKENLDGQNLDFIELKERANKGLRPIKVVIYHDAYGDRYFIDSVDTRTRCIVSSAYQNILKVVKDQYNIKLESSQAHSAKYHYMGRTFDTMSEMLEWSKDHELLVYTS